MRYVLECEWTGYSSSQRHVVHREVITEHRAKRLKELRTIVFTDNTSLIISIRECGHREKIHQNLGYRDLILSAEGQGSRVLVSDLK